MNRRQFAHAMACGLLTAPFIANAEPKPAIRRIGILSAGPEDPDDIQYQSAMLRQFGWVDGQNVLVVRRYANGGIEQFRPLAEELVRLKLDLIVALGTPATMAAKSATSTIPIVFAASDPVGQGLVATLGRPGGNVTGFSTAGPEIEAKRIEILREVLPTLTRVGVMENSNIPYYRSARKGIERACRSLGIEPIFVEVAAASDLTGAVAEVARRGGQALTAQSDFFDVEGELLRAALKHKLPTMVSPIYVRQVGALIAYDPNFAEIGQRTMAFVDRVLRGAKPANLPVEQPTKFDLIINLTTARALRLTIAKSLLLRADELIQ